MTKNIEAQQVCGYRYGHCLQIETCSHTDVKLHSTAYNTIIHQNIMHSRMCLGVCVWGGGGSICIVHMHLQIYMYASLYHVYACLCECTHKNRWLDEVRSMCMCRSICCTCINYSIVLHFTQVSQVSVKPLCMKDQKLNNKLNQNRTVI